MAHDEIPPATQGSSGALPGGGGGSQHPVLRAGDPQTSEQRATARAHAAAVMVLESVGIRDGRDLDVLLEILTTSPVERNRLRAAEVLSRNRATAASLLASASAPSVDARSVTLNIGAGEGAMLPGVPDAVRAALAAFRKDAGGDGKASP